MGLPIVNSPTLKQDFSTPTAFLKKNSLLMDSELTKEAFKRVLFFFYDVFVGLSSWM